jgi:uncharacterized metal-binding protein YceD (DUF177 family)
MTAASSLPLSLPFRTDRLPSRKPTRFALAPDAEQRARIAAHLGILSVSGLRFEGAIIPEGRSDMRLEAVLTARVVQPCSVTLEPVGTDLRETVIRRYVAGMALPEADEVEIPEDTDSEPLPEVIDAGHVALEALALALPLYPRAPGAGLGAAEFAPPGAEPLAEEKPNPFAALAALKSKLEDGGSGGT